MAGIGRIKEFCEALVTDGKVGRDADCGPLPPFTDADREFFQTDGFGGRNIDFRDAGGGWGLLLQGTHKRIKAGSSSFEMNLNPLFTITNPACQSIRASKTVNEGSESDPLHHAPHAYGTGTRHF
jgi:hypothetical protein